MKKVSTLVLILFSCKTLVAQGETSPFSYSPNSEYHTLIAESNTFENGTLQKVVIDGYDSRVPFYYIAPDEKEGNKHVILLHGITGSKNGWMYPMTSLSKNFIALKDSLLALGYTLIIPDAKYHGERSYEADFVSPITLAQNQDVEKLYSLFSATVKDLRIIMDYIQSNSESNSGFDVIGYSMGGMLAILLNSADGRLNKTVACVPPLDLKKAGMRIGLEEDNAERLKDISPKNFAPTQKAPISLLVGNNDGWYTTQEVEDFFDNIALEQKVLKFYDSGHYLPQRFINDAIAGILSE